MPGCILTSPEGISSRERMVAAAEAVGSKVMPMITQFCDFHHQHHAVRMQGSAVDSRYGAAPVEVNMSPEEERNEGVFHHKEFCNTCSSYHMAGECRGKRNRETVGS